MELERDPFPKTTGVVIANLRTRKKESKSVAGSKTVEATSYTCSAHASLKKDEVDRTRQPEARAKVRENRFSNRPYRFSVAKGFENRTRDEEATLDALHMLLCGETMSVYKNGKRPT